MSKSIEKESDGYIRDLKKKRREEIKWVVLGNAFLLIFPAIIIALLLITAFKPIPNDLITETHIFQEYVESKNYRFGGHPAYFVSASGDYFAIKFADADDFLKGQAYEISYNVGLFHTWAYNISDGSKTIISEEEWINYRNKNINDLPIEIIIFFGIYLIIAIPVNIFVLKFNVKTVYEINQKIEKRRAKRNKKE